MSGFKAFRFATGSFGLARESVLAEARMAESLGYDTFLMADHLYDNLGPFPTLMMIAEQTGLRLGTCCATISATRC
jgi:alkanesulfonate monooxygenase SsuD/methylene tetrahydromethanopterin reductase-like flavin-dependent oxidoreductase (luciferase family)